jgi:cell division transport system permease protein
MTRPLATGMVWLAVAISLALPGAMLLTLDNLRPLVPDLERPAQVSVMLDGELNLEQAEALQLELVTWASVEDATLVRRDEALAVFGEQTGLSGVLTSLDHNPLPHALLVSPTVPRTDTALSQLVEAIGALSGVDRVIVDSQWMSRLDQALLATERWGLALGAAMVLGAILALANTLHLAIDARREEILVVRVIGGSQGFIRRPFLYTGLYFGAGGGVLAGVMLWMLSLWIAGPVNALFVLYGSSGEIQGPGVRYLLALIALGAVLGWLTSWIASARYFNRLEAH